MSVYVLDTDHFSLHLRGHQQVRERLALIAPEQVVITIITAEEHLRGRLAQVNKAAPGNVRSTAYAYLHKAITDLAKLNILDYGTAADTIYQELKRQRLRVGSQDLRIAAITLANQGLSVRGCVCLLLVFVRWCARSVTPSILNLVALRPW